MRAPSFPCCVDWLPDGRLLVVSAHDGLLLRREPDGTLVTHGDVSGLSDPPAQNELVVDGRGNAYLNGMIATEWSGPANMFQGPRTGQVLTTGAPAPGAGWP